MLHKKRYKFNEARDAELDLHKSVVGDCVHYRTISIREVVSA